MNESRHMAMPHPIHIHNVQFQVIERHVLREFATQDSMLDEGYVDEGWRRRAANAGRTCQGAPPFEDYEGYTSTIVVESRTRGYGHDAKLPGPGVIIPPGSARLTLVFRWILLHWNHDQRELHRGQPLHRLHRPRHLAI